MPAFVGDPFLPKWDLIRSDIWRRLFILCLPLEFSGSMMEVNMERHIEHDDDILDLGVASVETKGAALDDSDNLGGRVRPIGIADD